MLAHPSIKKRHFAFEHPEELVDEDPDARSARFRKWAVTLSKQAALAALESAGLRASEVTGLVVNTCTGYLCPGLSTYLAEELSLKSNVKAYDLVGGGCGGALPNLQLCSALSAGEEQGAVLSIAVEICSATFQMGDDMSLLVSNALFGDGASAAIVWNRDEGARIVGSASCQVPEYREDIRFVYRNGQLHNQLSQRLPSLVAVPVRKTVESLLREHSLSPGDIRHWAIHPGGERILAALQKELGLSDAQLRFSRETLAQYGNMSSPTVMFIVRELLRREVAAGEYCVMLAFGAGFSAHAFLVQGKGEKVL